MEGDDGIISSNDIDGAGFGGGVPCSICGSVGDGIRSYGGSIYVIGSCCGTGGVIVVGTGSSRISEGTIERNGERVRSIEGDDGRSLIGDMYRTSSGSWISRTIGDGVGDGIGSDLVGIDGIGDRDICGDVSIFGV